MNLKDVGLAVGVVLSLFVGFMALGKAPVQPPFAANPGPDYTETQFFNGGIAYGGGCFATTTSGTIPVSALANNSCIAITSAGAGQAVLSITLPASSSMSALIPSRAGSCRDWWVDTTNVVAATTTTFVAGTGVNVVGLDATGLGTGSDVIDGNEYGRLTLCRERDGDVAAFVEEWIHAD